MDKMESGALLITGCPRSGTKSVQAWFAEHGVELGHEQPGEKGTIEWRHAYTDFGHEDSPFVIQQTLVRHPCPTIQSLSSLIMNCDRKNETWTDILLLAEKGGWRGKLAALDFIGAATDWWITVYERLAEYPVLKMEHIPKLPKLHTHPRVNRTFDIDGYLADNDRLWDIAAVYGYDKTKESQQCL